MYHLIRLLTRQRLLLDRYLGLYSTEIEAAVAYDTESVLQRGAGAVTNFALAEYKHLLGALIYPIPNIYILNPKPKSRVQASPGYVLPWA